MANFKTFTLHWDKMPTKIKYQVLTVRCKAYQKAGKFSLDRKPRDVMDQYDRMSTFPMVLYNGKVVATLRIINHEDDRLLEHDYAGPKLRQMIDKSCLEITRVCVDPEFSRLGLTNLLFYEAASSIVDLCFKSKKFHILGSCTKNLLPVYRRIGCRPLGLSYKHPEMGDNDHFVFIADAKELMRGEMAFISYSLVGAKASLRAKQLYDYRTVSPWISLALCVHYPLLNFLRLRSWLIYNLRTHKRKRSSNFLLSKVATQ